MKRYLFVAGGVLILALLIFLFTAHHKNPQLKSPTFKSPIMPTRVITIAGRSVTVDLAITSAQQELGLGGRDGLAPDHGMLFVFPRDDYYAFWMKDMHFSIDMVWLSADGHVITIAPSVSPATYPRNFRPSAPARFVVELPAGFARAYGLKEGDIVR